jgi:quinoprotein dehydrogenase-associated probable ABC transporter substrate-binding protein
LNGRALCVAAVGVASLTAASIAPAFGQAPPAAPLAGESTALKVCADPNNLPLSDKDGGGYENKIAEALARDLKRRVEYTYFPQGMGFVRQTLRARDDATQAFKCDVIIGVPKGYELAATTHSYMRSTYALVVPKKAEFASLKTADDLLKLPKDKLQKLRIGIFGRSPASDWLLRAGLIDRARLYPPQSGDPEEHPASIIERDLSAKEIDMAALWGPMAGFLASRHKDDQGWVAVPFATDPQIHFEYEMAMGVRFGEKEWKDTLDQWITDHQGEIDKILTDYSVPLRKVAPPGSPPGT